MLRKTRKRYFILSAIAFVAGLFIAGFVSVLYIKYNNSYMNENKEIEKTIVVLDMNLKKGTILSGEHFRKVKIHSEENSINSVKTEEVLGKELKQDMKKGMIITEAAVYKESPITDDLRVFYADFIEGLDKVIEDELFDIRIVFPNGEDYILAAGKSVEKKTDTGAYIKVDERELMYISGARVDMNVYKGTRIYACTYLSKDQKIPYINYPVNNYIFKLSNWSPNLLEEITKEDYIEKRKILEDNLYEFTGVLMSLGSEI
jgi:hypothetical protein